MRAAIPHEPFKNYNLYGAVPEKLHLKKFLICVKNISKKKIGFFQALKYYTRYIHCKRWIKNQATTKCSFKYHSLTTFNVHLHRLCNFQVAFHINATLVSTSRHIHEFTMHNLKP